MYTASNKRRAAARLHLAQPLHDRLGVGRGVDQQLGFIPVGDQIAAESRIAGQHIQHHLDRRILEILPVDARRVAHVEQEPDNHGLTPLAREVFDILLLPFVQDAKIPLVEIGYEPAAVVGHGDRHDHLVHRYLDRRLRRQRRIYGLILSDCKTPKKRDSEGAAKHCFHSTRKGRRRAEVSGEYARLLGPRGYRTPKTAITRCDYAPSAPSQSRKLASKSAQAFRCTTYFLRSPEAGVCRVTWSFPLRGIAPGVGTAYDTAWILFSGLCQSAQSRPGDGHARRRRVYVFSSSLARGKK